MDDKRFQAIDLSFNIGIADRIGRIGNVMDCNPGGSVICEPGSKGCGGGGMTCVGNSCSGASATRDIGFDSRILVNPEELVELQKELRAVVARFAR